MADAEKELDIVVRAQAQQMAALQDVKTQVDGLSTSVNTSATAHEKHTTAAKAASAAEHDLTTEARESAKAMGELGAKGGEMFERFSALTTAAGGLQGTLLGVGLLAAGAVVEGAQRVNETYQEQQKAAQDLKQATDATGVGYEALSAQFEEFADQNKAYITNENEAKDVLASFVRAGFDAQDSMKDLGIALDLASLKHEDLTTAGNQTLQMLEGQGRVAKQLGIDITALKNSDDNAAKAAKDYDAATKVVASDQDKLATADEALKLKEDELSGKRKVTQADLDQLKAKQDAVKKASDDLTKAQEDQKKALDDLHGATSTQSQVQAELSNKLADGRKATNQQQQAANELGHEWDRFSAATGPGLNTALAEIETALANVLAYVNDNIGEFENFATEVADAIPGLSQAAAFIDAISSGASAGTAVAAAFGGTPGNYPAGVSRRAGGGPADPFGSYIVGEEGPELLSMGAAGGYVTPLAGGAGGGGMDDTNELLGQAVAILGAMLSRMGSPGFSTASYQMR